MRIAVDARALGPDRTGVGRYLEGLLAAWTAAFPGDSFHLVSPRPIELPGALEPARRNGRISVDVAPGLPGTVWLQTLAPIQARRGGAAAFFGPLGVLPLALSMPAVATVHDVTPLLFPEWHTLANRLGVAPFLGATVRSAAALAAVSTHTRGDLVRLFPDSAGRCAVVLNGLTRPTADEAREAEAGGPPHVRPYVFYVGTLEPRKNVGRLLEAMERIWDRDPGFPDLVVAGGTGWGLPDFARRLSASRHAPRIRSVGYVPTPERLRLLRGARLLAYPSLYEGFGFPPLEAMAEGTPVVASASSSLPEVVGDAGLLPDPTDVAAIAAALEKAHRDEAWRRAAAAKGIARAATFTWERAARATRALFEGAL